MLNVGWTETHQQMTPSLIHTFDAYTKSWCWHDWNSELRFNIIFFV